MTKIYTAAAMCLMVSASVASKAFAVWPPATSLQDETVPASRSQLPLTGRLEDDVRRLDQVLQDLKEDQAELKQSTVALGTATPKSGASVQEDHDGRSVR